MEVKKKPESFYPARILQSAIRGVVGSRYYCLLINNETL